MAAATGWRSGSRHADVDLRQNLQHRDRSDPAHGKGVEREYADYFGHSQTIVELADQGRPEQMVLVDRLLAQEELGIYGALEGLRTEVKGFVEDGLRSSARRETWLGVLILVLTGGAILLDLPAAAIVTRGLVAPIKRLIAGVQAVRSGDLAFDLKVTSRDEVGLLAEGFREMVAGLRAKEQITETFGRCVDPRVVERLIRDPELRRLRRASPSVRRYLNWRRRARPTAPPRCRSSG